MASTKQGSLGFTQTEAAITEHESLFYVLSIYALFVEGFVCVWRGGGVLRMGGQSLILLPGYGDHSLLLECLFFPSFFNREDTSKIMAN